MAIRRTTDAGVVINVDVPASQQESFCGMTEKEKKVNVNSAEAMENVYLTSLLYMFKISILSLIKKKT